MQVDKETYRIIEALREHSDYKSYEADARAKENHMWDYLCLLFECMPRKD